MPPLSSAAQRSGIATSLTVTLAQIIEGEAKCVYCKTEARVTLASGADPIPEPMCWSHARTMMNFTVRNLDAMWPLEAYDAT
jgi:hypothetical protein